MTDHYPDDRDSGARVLVIEDERRLANAVRRGLESLGMTVQLAADGITGYQAALVAETDLIVLDLMLPGMAGEDVCRGLRGRGVWTPILVLTAKDEEEDEAALLDMGADDYVRKPFAFEVLRARLAALLRRGTSGPDEVAVGDLVLDSTHRTVRRGAVPLRLTRREFALLELLARRAGETVTKEQLLDLVWADARRRDTNLVEVYIGYLRRKIDVPFQRRTLRTVRGQGYLLDPAQ